MKQDLVDEFLADVCVDAPKLKDAFRRHCRARGFTATRAVRDAWSEFAAGWDAALSAARKLRSTAK